MSTWKNNLSTQAVNEGKHGVLKWNKDELKSSEGDNYLPLNTLNVETPRQPNKIEITTEHKSEIDQNLNIQGEQNKQQWIKENLQIQSLNWNSARPNGLNRMNSRTRRSMMSSVFQPKTQKWKKKVTIFLDSGIVLTIMSLLTVFALFAADIQAAWWRIEVDHPFNIIQCIWLFLFATEWFLNCIAKENYLFSFFFWWDLIATVSWIQDIDYIMNPILGYGPANPNSNKSSVQAAKAIAKVSSASRAARVLRVIRIVRLIRMVKLYKSVYIAREKQEKQKKEEKMKLLQRLEQDTIEMNNSTNRDSKKDIMKLSIYKASTSRSRERDGNNASSSNISKDIHWNGNDGNNNYLQSELAWNLNQNNVDDWRSNRSNNNGREETKKATIEIMVKVNNNSYKCWSSNLGQSTNIQTPYSSKNEKLVSSNTQGNNKEASTWDTNYNKKHSFGKNKSVIQEFEEEELWINESKISKIITESITKKVIVLILCLLIIFPLLSDDFYTDDSSITYSFIASLLTNNYHLYPKSNIQQVGIFTSSEALEGLFDQSFPPINITIDGSITYSNEKYSTDFFRFKEVNTVYSEDGKVMITYSILEEKKLEGFLNFIQTLFVCFCLTISSIIFENDANKLVWQPLEIMIEICENVSKDPINAKNSDNLQTGIKAQVNKEEVTANEKDNENYEVVAIKSALIKISALLAIGFGEAGGEILKKNLSIGQEWNTRLKGQNKTAIFGFCDIRQFEEINLALEEKSIWFLNEIAEIVHSSVDRFGGATNKNIGEAFLNVWKFYNETLILGKKGEVKGMERKDNLLEIDPSNAQVGITADMSVFAFLRVIMKISKNLDYISVRYPEIMKRIHNFKLNMGFGWHVGYGIEGAVGSSYKIDASYLSPNVNIAARLESATRQFGVSLLISGPQYKWLSDDWKRICRFVDCVMVKGSEQPLDLYTVDVNTNIRKLENNKNICIMGLKEKRKRFMEKKEMLQREVEVTKSVTRIILEKSSYLEWLHTNKNEEFYINWDEGVDMYKEGNFRKAGDFFKKCLQLDPEDGPAKTLLKYFDRVSYVTPIGWKGVRELTSK